MHYKIAIHVKPETLMFTCSCSSICRQFCQSSSMLASSAGGNVLNCLSFKLSLFSWLFSMSTGVSSESHHSCLRTSLVNFSLISFMLPAVAEREVYNMSTYSTVHIWQMVLLYVDLGGEIFAKHVWMHKIQSSRVEIHSQIAFSKLSLPFFRIMPIP